VWNGFLPARRRKEEKSAVGLKPDLMTPKEDLEKCDMSPAPEEEDPSTQQREEDIQMSYS